MLAILPNQQPQEPEEYLKCNLCCSCVYFPANALHFLHRNDERFFGGRIAIVAKLSGNSEA